MKKNAFTLIELLVVIAIIAILAVTILAALNQARKSARDAKRKEMVRNVMTAIETYAAINDEFPNDIDQLVTDGLLAENPEEYLDDGASSIDPDDETYCIVSDELEAKEGTWFYASNGVTAENSEANCSN